MVKEAVWFCGPDVKKRVIAGKTILLTIRGNRLLVLNRQAAAIWDQLENLDGCRESEIWLAIKCEYLGVSDERLRTDIHSFLSGLHKSGFIHQRGVSLKLNFSGDQKFNAASHFAFSEYLHQIAAKSNIPISGGLEITQRCNLRCLHCYIDNQPASNGAELSTDESYNLLDQIAESGCLWLLFTGGEPLLRKDFSEVYYHAKKLGMIITVFTSATTFTEQIADLFAEYPPFLIEATLHGVTEATFDAVSGVRGSFRHFCHGLELLRKRNIAFHLKTIVMRQNLHEIGAARTFALDMGAKEFRFDPMVNMDFFHSSKALGLRISVEEATKLDFLNPYRSRWKKIFRGAAAKNKNQHFSSNFLFPCRAGKCSFTISADGQLLPCVLMRVPAYRLREMTFAKGWEELNHYATTVRMKENNPCLICSAKTCPKCPAWGYLEHGDPDVKSQFACALQQKREKLFLSHNI